MAPSAKKPGFRKLAASLDKIATADLAYELEQDLKSGMTSDQLRKKYQARLTARSILIAATADDDGKAVAAIKEVTDRNEGKAVERKSISHHLEKLTDEQLEAMLRTEISDLERPLEKPTDEELH